MRESKIEVATGMCVVALTRHIMKKNDVNYEVAYKVLLAKELYQLLLDTETSLYLETNQYLIEAYNAEADYGKDALYEYINRDI